MNISCRRFCLLLLYVFGYYALGEHRQRYVESCNGYWIYNTTVLPSERYPHFNESDTNKTSIAFLQHACPAEESMYSCYYSASNFTRALYLMGMQFFPHYSDKCHAFDSEKLLYLLRNRKLIYLGDSVVIQTWVSLFCRLYQSTRMFVEFYDIEFHSFGSSCNAINCVLGGKKHGAIGGGYIKFGHPYNVTIFMHIMAHFQHKETIQTVINQYHTNHDDIVVVNLGVRYNHRDEYVAALKLFVLDLSEELKRRPIDVPRFFFQQSTPQHFEGNNNGYFTPSASNHSEALDSCRIAENEDTVAMKSLEERDWRNRELDRVINHLSPPNVHIPIIYIAKGLYSQALAHVGRTAIASAAFDCTHWCYPSGVFDYIDLVLYNTLRRELAMN